MWSFYLLRCCLQSSSLILAFCNDSLPWVQLMIFDSKTFKSASFPFTKAPEEHQLLEVRLCCVNFSILEIFFTIELPQFLFSVTVNSERFEEWGLTVKPVVSIFGFRITAFSSKSKCWFQNISPKPKNNCIYIYVFLTWGCYKNVWC